MTKVNKAQPNSNQVQTISVLGAGSWGTALADLIARNGHHVKLWTRTEQHANEVRSSGENAKYLPDFPLASNLSIHSDLAEAVQGSDHILLAVPSHVVEALLQQLKQIMTPAGLCWAIKGIEATTHQTISSRVQYYFSGCAMAMLAGPSFAKEVMAQLPTAVTVAANDSQYAACWADLFRNKQFRVYCSDDLIAAEIAGTTKNVLAIACGIADGLGFGANTRAALITRGLTEMTRLGVAMGANEASFSELAGIGDLLLTCTDNQSRNRRFGLLLGEGKTQTEAVSIIGQVVEGLHNARQVLDLAAQYHVSLPICQQVNAVIENQQTPQQAAEVLLSRGIASDN